MRFQLLGGALVQAFVLFLAAAGVSPAGAGDPPRPAAPVCAFLDPERAPRAALLEAKLLAEASVTWVERAAIDKILKEQTLQAAFGPQGGADRVGLGKLLKADLLVLVRPLKGKEQVPAKEQVVPPLKEAKEPGPVKEVKVLEVVVSDTARGLRLAVRAVPVTKDADADVAALRAAVEFGLKKFREQVREVAAVPPFASTNLSYDYEHLKGAYGKLVEQAALASPGVVVVELAEAEAIAREIKLTDPGATVKRSPPLYLLGEFRHQGRGPEVRVTLKLQANRGGQPVGTVVEQTVAPSEAPAILRSWAAERLATGKTGPVQALDPKVEAKQLAELSRSRRRVGDWADALALLEASLLLDPNQPELNADAMEAIKFGMFEVIRVSKKDIDVYRRAAQFHRRGLEHMETLITSGAKLPRFVKGREGGRIFSSAFLYPRRLPPNVFVKETPLSPDVQELIQELERESRDKYLRLLPIIVKDGDYREIESFIRTGLTGLPAAERFAEIGRLILQYQDFPSMIFTAHKLMFFELLHPTVTVDELQACRKLVDRLEKKGNLGVRTAAERMRQDLSRFEKQILMQAEMAVRSKLFIEEAKKRPPPQIPQPVRLTKEERENLIEEKLKGGPLRLIRLKATSAGDEQFFDKFDGILPVGPGMDIFWAMWPFLPNSINDPGGRPQVGFNTIGRSGPVLLVMKEKGKLQRVWEKPGASNFSAICFDGRYVWASTRTNILLPLPSLFIFDLVAGKVFEVTAADGLPQPSEEIKPPYLVQRVTLQLSPLEPGRVCVAGGFGRGWVGVATFDPVAQKATVKVIHEAREFLHLTGKEKDPWLNRDLAFAPLYAQTLRGSPDAQGKTPCRVLIGREVQATGTTSLMVSAIVKIRSHPLVIDPDGPGVTVLAEPLFVGSVRHSAVAAQGALLVAEDTRASGSKVRLLRIEFPGSIRYLRRIADIESRFPSDFSWPLVGLSKDRLHFARNTPMGPDWKGRKFPTGSTYWFGDLDGKNLHEVTDGIPQVKWFAQSSHYGLVAWCEFQPNIRGGLCSVLVSDAAGQ